MTACHDMLELLSASLDQTLSAEEQARLDAHRAECAECHTAWKELQWTYAQIKGLEAVEPPPWLASKIMARIRAEAVPQASFWRRFILPIVLKPQLKVASILLLAATGFYLLRSQRPGQDVFAELKQQEAQAPMPSQAEKSPTARDKVNAEPGNAPKVTQKSPPEGRNDLQMKASKPMESGFAPPPMPSPQPAMGVAKLERDNASLGTPASAPPPPPPPPSPLAGVSTGSGVVAESVAAPARQAKKSVNGGERSDRANRAEAESKVRARESTGQLMDASERKEKVDAVTFVIRLEMADPRSAKPLIERELVRAGVSVLPQREPDASRILHVRLSSQRLPDLLSRLAKLGKVLEQPDIPSENTSLITINIRW